MGVIHADVILSEGRTPRRATEVEGSPASFGRELREREE
jgi:hypothetical protein